MDRPSVVRLWRPKKSATLEGVFHLEGGLNSAVKTEDGTLWLLESDAEAQFEALDPHEGQVVHVHCVRDGQDPPTYHVTIY